MRTQQPLTLCVVASMVIASGCTSMAADNTQAAVSGDAVSLQEYKASQQRVTELESTLAQRESDLSATEARLASIDTSSAGSASAANTSSLFPPNPKAGECYARVLIPAKFRSTTEKVLKSEASERIEVLPARYETGQETVLVKEASTKLEVIPAVYGDVQERVLVKPASQEIVEVPAKYDTLTERVVDQPAHTAWKKGSAGLQAANILSQTTNDTGEVMCLVEVPATYKNVTKRVLVTPARTQVREIPAEYKTVTKRVVKTPPTTREVKIPAQYDTMTVRKLVSPASEKRIKIPAAYQTVTRNEKVTAEKMEWNRVMCEVNMTAANVRTLQTALADKGYYKAGVDGIMGRNTLSAARAYALDNNLPAGSNYISMEVAKKLGLKI